MANIDELEKAYEKALNDFCKGLATNEDVDKAQKDYYDEWNKLSLSQKMRRI